MPEVTGHMPVELPPMGNLSPQDIADKSKTHWVWTPYMDINNMAPWGLKSLLGYRGQAWSVFKRCTPYPLGNMEQMEVDRAAVAETHASGYSLNPDSIPQINYTKYAGEQAHELGESYGDEQGLRILIPLTGIDDPEIVNRIIQVVQPFAYLVYEMTDEFAAKTIERKIDASNLSEREAEMARALGVIFAHGAERARLKALSEYNALITSMSKASLGQPGISEPNDFHEWLCVNLNKSVPKRINRMEQQETSGGADSSLMRVLLERDEQRANELAELKREVAGRGRQLVRRTRRSPAQMAAARVETVETNAV